MIERLRVGTRALATAGRRGDCTASQTLGRILEKRVSCRARLSSVLVVFVRSSSIVVAYWRTETPQHSTSWWSSLNRVHRGSTMRRRSCLTLSFAPGRNGGLRGKLGCCRYYGQRCRGHHSHWRCFWIRARTTGSVMGSARRSSSSAISLMLAADRLRPRLSGGGGPAGACCCGTLTPRLRRI